MACKNVACCRRSKLCLSQGAERWRSYAIEHRHDKADAYLLSCTTVRSSEVAEALEQVLGRPVVTSNTATVWHCLRMMGVDDRVNGYGRLLAQQ